VFPTKSSDDQILSPQKWKCRREVALIMDRPIAHFHVYNCRKSVPCFS